MKVEFNIFAYLVLNDKAMMRVERFAKVRVKRDFVEVHRAAQDYQSSVAFNIDFQFGISPKIDVANTDAVLLDQRVEGA